MVGHDLTLLKSFMTKQLYGFIREGGKGSGREEREGGKGSGREERREERREEWTEKRR